jgi:hypothetical protein
VVGDEDVRAFNYFLTGKEELEKPPTMQEQVNLAIKEKVLIQSGKLSS